MKATIIVSSLIFFATYAFSCTTIHVPQSPENWVLKSYDWHQSHVSAIVNPRGLKKTAFHLKTVKLPTWTSKYSSLTFHQHGRELPLGGINETGLTIEIMWLNATEYPANSSGEVVNELQWIQYHLDRYSNVKDVVESAKTLGVAAIYAKVHYLVCDTSSACASVEFLEGKPVIHTGDQMLAPVLTNNSYADSVDYLKGFKDFGGALAEVPPSSESLNRFARGAILARQYEPELDADPVGSAFGILRSVGQGDYTKLNVAYDRRNNRVYFRTFLRPSIKSINLNGLFVSCLHPARIMSLNTTKDGDVTSELETYTPGHNAKLVDEGLSELAGALPDGALKKVAKYPDSFTCEGN